MPKAISRIFKSPLTYAITGGALGTAGAGAGGYFLGKRQGAEQTANVMATQFSRANQLENQQIAKHFFLKGLQHNPTFKKESSMDKIAVLEEVYNEAFVDELEKIAAIPGMGKIVSALKAGVGGVKSVSGKVGRAYAESAKDLAAETRKAIKYTGQAMKGKGKRGFELSRGAYMKDALKSMGRGGKKGGLVLGTVGGVGVGAGGVGMMAGKKKD